MPVHYHHLGAIASLSDKPKCLDTMSRKAGQKIGVSICHGLGGNQVFAYTKSKQIMSDDNCLDAASASAPVKLLRCHGLGGNQAWVYSLEEQTIKHRSTGQCLTLGEGDIVNLQECIDGNSDQMWSLDNSLKWKVKEPVL